MSPIRVEYGTTRSVIIVGPIVIKFPKVLWYLKNIRSILLCLISGHVSVDYIVGCHKLGWIILCNGITSNWTEYTTYIKTRASFLVPVFASCGLISIQLYEDGKVPSMDESIGIADALSKKCNLCLNIDPHDFHSPENWRKTRNGYKLIDYGDKYYRRSGPISGLILALHPEITEICSQTQ